MQLKIQKNSENPDINQRIYYVAKLSDPLGSIDVFCKFTNEKLP
jgi:hypothetical protein